MNNKNRENFVMDTSLGYSYNYKSKIPFLIVSQQLDGTCPLYIFVENERFCNPSTQDKNKSFAQSVGEMLSIALNNFNDDEKKQEVFAIRVRHRYFSFWRALLSEQYLEKLVKNPASLGESDFGVWQQYPATQRGLDICKPEERKEIVRLTSGLMRYIESVYSLN